MYPINFVLVEPSHPGNIGSAARAMKTMGMSRLTLVNPQSFPHADATAMASGASDVLAAARVVDSLDSAVKDCRYVIGTSARLRRLEQTLMMPKEAAATVYREATQHEVALVFGRERSGLNNDELARCHALVHIPSDPDFSSLNLAAAIQILAYECRLQQLGETPLPETQSEEDLPASSARVQGMIGHLEEVMRAIEFIDPKQYETLMLRLRRLFNRARPTDVEINILRGIFADTLKRLPEVRKP